MRTREPLQAGFSNTAWATFTYESALVRQKGLGQVMRRVFTEHVLCAQLYSYDLIHSTHQLHEINALNPSFREKASSASLAPAHATQLIREGAGIQTRAVCSEAHLPSIATWETTPSLTFS